MFKTRFAGNTHVRMNIAGVICPYFCFDLISFFEPRVGRNGSAPWTAWISARPSRSLLCAQLLNSGAETEKAVAAQPVAFLLAFFSPSRTHRRSRCYPCLEVFLTKNETSLLFRAFPYGEEVCGWLWLMKMFKSLFENRTLSKKAVASFNSINS